MAQELREVDRVRNIRVEAEPHRIRISAEVAQERGTDIPSGHTLAAKILEGKVVLAEKVDAT
jgi:hypothetical protein